MLQLFRRHWWILLPVVLECLIFHAWLQRGELMGGDWLRRNTSELLGYFPWPHVWNGAQQAGENTEVYMGSFPIFAVMGALARLGLPWDLIERICYFWPYLIIAPLASYALAYRLTRNSFAAAMGSLYFSINAFTIQATERGAIPSILAVAVLPGLVYFYLRFLERPSAKLGLLSASILTVILIYDIRYVYIGIVITALLTIERLWRERSFKWLWKARFGLAAILGTMLVFSLYWIVPQLLEPANPGAGYASVQDYEFISGFMSPAHALSDFEVFYHWVADDEPFHKYPADPQFFIIPVLAFLSLAFTYRRRFTAAFAVTAFIGLLLTSGPEGAFHGVNIWIFTHVPGMSLFRDATKWMAASNLGYTMLLALGCARFAALLRRTIPRNVSAYLAATAVLAVGLHALFMSDAFNPIRYRLFQVYRTAPDTIELERFIASQPAYNRTLVFPRDLESMRATEDHPYIEAQQMLSYPKTDGIRHLNMDFTSISGSFSNPLLPALWRELNIKYVVVPYDDDKIIYKPQISNIEFGDAIQIVRAQRWLKFYKKIGRHYIFEITQPMPDRAFIAPKPFIFNGSGQSLIATIPSGLWNSRAAAIFTDQPLGTSLLKTVPNYVAGVPIFDENVSTAPEKALTFSQASTFNAAAHQRGLQYEGAAASAPASSEHIYESSLATLTFNELDGRWPRTTKMQAQLLQTPSHVEIIGKWAPSQTYVGATPPVSELFFKVDPQLLLNGGKSVTLGSRPVTGTLMNGSPCSVVGTIIFADLVLKKIAKPDVSATINGIPHRVEFLSSGMFDAPTQMVIRTVNLRPGPNSITLVRNGNARRGQIVLPNQASFPQEGNPKCEDLSLLPLSNAVDGSRLIVTLRKEQSPNTSLWLYRNLNVPVADYPAVSILTRGDTFVKGAVPEVEFDLERASDGAHVGLIEQLDTTVLNNTFYVRGELNTALDDTFGRELSTHLADRSWMFENRLSKEPDGASGFTLKSVRLVMQRALPIASARLVITGSQIGTSKSYYGLEKADRLPSETETSLGNVRSVKLTGFYGAATKIKKSGSLLTASFLAGPIMFARDRRIEMTFNLTKPDAAHAFLNFAIVAPDGYDIAMTWRGAKGQQGTVFTSPGPNEQTAALPNNWLIKLVDSPWSYKLGHARCLPVTCDLGYTAKAAPNWMRYRIDLSTLNGQLPAPVDGWPLQLSITFVPQAGRANLAPTVSIITGPSTLAPLDRTHIIDTLRTDNQPVHVTSTHRDDENNTIVADGTATFDPRTNVHFIESAPSYPLRPLSLYLSKGAPKTFIATPMRDVHNVNPTEIVGSIRTSGGILVLTQAYDPGWRALMLPEGANLSGSVLFDLLRFSRYQIPEDKHFLVNDLLNGWDIKPATYHLAFVFFPQGYVELGAIIAGVMSLLWCTLVLRRRG